MDGPVAQADRARARVDHQVANAQGPAVGPPVRAAQHRPHARQQLAVEERLDDVVVGAALEPAQAVGVAAAAGEHQDRDLGVDPAGLAVGRADPVQQLQPAPVAQAEVEQHDRRVADLDLADALRSARCTGHLEPVSR